MYGVSLGFTHKFTRNALLERTFLFAVTTCFSSRQSAAQGLGQNPQQQKKKEAQQNFKPASLVLIENNNNNDSATKQEECLVVLFLCLSCLVRDGGVW
jgi:hypothetical protein